jgi:hypothetical protein
LVTADSALMVALKRHEVEAIFLSIHEQQSAG